MFKQLFFTIAALLQFILAIRPDSSVSVDGSTANYTLTYDPGVLEAPLNISIRARIYAQGVEITDAKTTESLEEKYSSPSGTSFVGEWILADPSKLSSIYVFAKSQDGGDFPDINGEFSIIGGLSYENGTQSTFSFSI